MSGELKNVEPIQKKFKITFYYSTTNSETGDKDYISDYFTGASVQETLNRMFSSKYFFYAELPDGTTRIINTSNILHMDIKEVPFEENDLQLCCKIKTQFMLKGPENMTKSKLKEKLLDELSDLVLDIATEYSKESGAKKQKVILDRLDKIFLPTNESE